MRMWMIPPSNLCDKHLLGEHGELHKFIPSFNKKHRIDRRISPIVQIELSSYKKRHYDLSTEMIRRGFNHKSPLYNKDLPDFGYLPKDQFEAKVDKTQSYKDLKSRCANCKKLIESK
jgi:3-methyladenine DNA glycosylase Tag